MIYRNGIPISAPEAEPHICNGGDCPLRAAAREPHPCPYDEEMAGGEVDTQCDCCVACTHECARDS